MKNVKTIIITTIILTVICAISAAGLAGTNELTADRIAAAEEKAQAEAMSRIIPNAEYKIRATTLNESMVEYSVALVDGKTAGYIFTNGVQGYGGIVKVMTGIGTDGKIIAIEVLSAADETPGLGQNIAKENHGNWSWEQFKGLNSHATVGGNVQAVTGATYSSKAVVESVNQALDMYKKITEEGTNNG